MTTYSIDMIFAYGQLGLEIGASQKDVEEILANATAYRFSTHVRIAQVQRMVKFFAARNALGAPANSFVEIRKIYHREAMRLHPDRNRGNPRAEEQLKIINAAYAVVDSIHREARDYFRLNEDVRNEIEREALEAVMRERPEEEKIEARSKRPQHNENSFRQAANEKTPDQDFPTRPVTRYMAASIPRFIRSARLGYLRLDCVIGSWFIEAENDLNYVFDVIMLPEREFLRARHYLGIPDGANPTLGRTRFTPSYIPKDIKTLVVPPNERDAVVYAKNYFRKLFGLDKMKE